jgi:nitrile hydratase accessory protein
LNPPEPNPTLPPVNPVFIEPWQAQAFALTLELSRRGHFSWAQWSQTLAEELQRAQARGCLSDGSHYYHHWLAALERLVLHTGLCDEASLRTRKLAWADAYRHTPHGQAVELMAATRAG